MAKRLKSRGLVQNVYSIVLPNNSSFAFISFRDLIDVYYTWVNQSVGLFWNVLDNTSQSGLGIVMSGGGSCVESNANTAGARILFGGANGFVQYIHPIRTQWVRIGTTTAGGATTTFSIIYKNV